LYVAAFCWSRALSVNKKRTKEKKKEEKKGFISLSWFPPRQSDCREIGRGGQKKPRSEVLIIRLSQSGERQMRLAKGKNRRKKSSREGEGDAVPSGVQPLFPNDMENRT